MRVRIDQPWNHRVSGKVDDRNSCWSRIRNPQNPVLRNQDVSVGCHPPGAYIDQPPGAHRGGRHRLLLGRRKRHQKTKQNSHACETSHLSCIHPYPPCLRNNQHTRHYGKAATRTALVRKLGWSGSPFKASSRACKGSGVQRIVHGLAIGRCAPDPSGLKSLRMTPNPGNRSDQATIAGFVNRHGVAAKMWRVCFRSV
jgi:hypothetical protein